MLWRRELEKLTRFRLVVQVDVLLVGQVSGEILLEFVQHLRRVLSDTTCSVVHETLPISAEAFFSKRGQYNSNVILN